MTFPFDLSGQRAFVAGGLGLIGHAVCRSLTACGATTIALEPESVAERAAASDGVTALAAFDVANGEALGARLAALVSEHGEPTIWVNAAYPRTEDWASMVPEVLDPESWRRNVEMQMNATCLLSTEIANRMAAAGGGSIVMIGSIYGVGGPDFKVYDGTDMTMPPAYTAIKAGLGNYTRYLASYYGPKGVRINTVCPGGVANNQPERFVANYSARTPMRRLAQADEIGGPVAFLASPAASYVTGATLMVDGGWSAI